MFDKILTAIVLASASGEEIQNIEEIPVEEATEVEESATVEEATEVEESATAGEMQYTTSDMARNMRALELFIADEMNYEKYCKSISWQQPEIDVYKEKLESQLPEECRAKIPLDPQ